MSPLRRRKKQAEQDLRLRARRARLAEREREAYERERYERADREAADADRETAVEAESAGRLAPPETPAPPAPPRREFQRPAPAPRPKARRARREKRRPRRRRRLDLGAVRSASASGARATVRQARPGVSRIGGSLGRGIGWLVAWPLRLAAIVERAITGLLEGTAGVAGRALAATERLASPARVMVGVIGGAAACLAFSQFVAYRGVEVGQPQYAAVSSVAPAPQTDRIDAGAAHAYVLLPLAAVAVGIAVVALLSGRWRLGRLVSLIGLAGVAISLAIDLPKGLDTGAAAIEYAGAKATLTEGFYAQLAASSVLVLCGFLLGAYLRQKTGAQLGRRVARRAPPRPGRTPSVAGGGA